MIQQQTAQTSQARHRNALALFSLSVFVAGGLFVGVGCEGSLLSKLGLNEGSSTQNVAEKLASAPSVQLPKIPLLGFSVPAPQIRPSQQVSPQTKPKAREGWRREAAPHQGPIITAQMLWRGARVEVVRGERLLRPRSGLSLAQVEAFVAPWGGHVRRSPTGVFQLSFGTQTRARQASVALLQSPLRKLIRTLRPHLICRGVSLSGQQARSYPKGIERKRRKGLFWFHSAAKLGYKGSSSEGGKGVVVALLDTGVAYEDAGKEDKNLRFAIAPDLMNTTFVQGIDLIEGDNAPHDDNQHGTFLATLMTGRFGIAPGMHLMPVKVLDHQRVGSELSVAEGIMYAIKHKAQVINLSLAFGHTGLPGKLLIEAIEAAQKAGVVVVAAAGNGGDKAGDSVHYPAAFRPVLAVGAVAPANPKGGLYVPSYSSQGGALDIVAPGGSLQHDNNQDGVRDGVISQTFSPEDPSSFSRWLMSGTSIAAAYTTGVVALLLSRGAAPTDVPQLLSLTAKSLDPTKRFTASGGAGVLRVKKSLRRLDALLSPTAPKPLKQQKCFVNILPLVQEHSTHKVKGRVAVEVLDQQQRPITKADVWLRWMGSVTGHVQAQTNTKGWATFISPPVDEKEAVFGVFVDKVVPLTRRQQRLPCVLHFVLRMTEGSAQQVDLALSQKNQPWLVHFDASTLSGVLLSQEVVRETYVLQAFGTGLISSVKVFGDDFFFSTVENLNDYQNWVTPLWSIGVGNAASPLDFGGGGSGVVWEPLPASAPQHFGSLLSPLLLGGSQILSSSGQVLSAGTSVSPAAAVSVSAMPLHQHVR